MRQRKRLFPLLGLALCAGAAWAGEAAPQVFVMDGARLAAARERVRQDDASLRAAVRRLEEQAREALEAGPFSVMDKAQTPPSGDKHDYMSQAPYFWPNPATADGLPYVRRDGERNPEIRKITDREAVRSMARAVQTLAFAHYFTGDEAYAARAALLLRTWFLDPKTRMNPNLEYGQGIPGRYPGRPYGIIEMQCLNELLDAIGLLGGSRAWTTDDQRAMVDWADRFLRWLLDSELGRAEAETANNHGTHYDVQVASLALFVGKADVAKRVVEAACERRVARQIAPDGGQPEELARTKAWSYSAMNLRGLLQLDRLGRHVDVDLWRCETADGRSVRKALDFLVPYAIGEREWGHPQINGFRPDAVLTLIRHTAQVRPEEKYDVLAARFPPLPPESLDHLTGVRLLPNDLDVQ